ncbi:MAG: hypothetical protein M1484_03265 [Patescibacteria group bacterium]|nr:hypothetical protein [Patescibacteria group bacterium]MCL5432081.1 hypothetical protein [Patescibacteria group bacterium]
MKPKRGQIAILAILLGLVGLTISLSVASRSLSDLKQVTVVDQGTKALAAAEAGIQYGLNQLSQGSNSCTPLAASGLSLNGIKGVQYTVCADTSSYGLMPAVAQDDVYQIDLSGLQPNVKSLAVLWKNPNAALEIIKIDKNNVLTRYIYDRSPDNSNPANNFATPMPGSACVSSGCADNSFNNGSCTGVAEIPFNNGDQLLRVKPLYASSDVAVCGFASGNSAVGLSLQNYQVTAIATTSGGVTKKVQSTLISGTLPTVFDSVIFNGGNLGY